VLLSGNNGGRRHPSVGALFYMWPHRRRLQRSASAQLGMGSVEMIRIGIKLPRQRL
jgi:hypothetical protein